MNTRALLFTTLASLFSAAAFADAIVPINSDSGLDCYVYATASKCTTTTITLHSAWATLPSDANWISYDKTGVPPDSVFQTYMGTDPVMAVFFNFNLDSPGYMKLKVWADDTANVYLDGIKLSPHAEFTQSTCSGQPIGCLAQDAGVFNKTLGAGDHSLKFDVFQVGTATDNASNPFGLAFTGVAAVPEPGSLGMLGIGLASLAAFAIRHKRRS